MCVIIFSHSSLVYFPFIRSTYFPKLLWSHWQKYHNKMSPLLVFIRSYFRTEIVLKKTEQNNPFYFKLVWCIIRHVFKKYSEMKRDTWNSAWCKIQWRDLFSCQILTNSDVFSLPFSRYLCFQVALLVYKFSDILNIILSSGKYDTPPTQKKDKL